MNKVELYFKNENEQCKDIEDILCEQKESEKGKNHAAKIKNEIKTLIVKKHMGNFEEVDQQEIEEKKQDIVH